MTNLSSFPVTDPDIYVIMPGRGLRNAVSAHMKDAFMLIDADLVRSRPGCPLLWIPATSEAKTNLGRIVANIVMIGALVAATGVVSREAVGRAVLGLAMPKCGGPEPAGAETGI